MRSLTMSFAVLLALATTNGVAQNQRETAVRNDKKRVSADSTWIYDNLLVAMDRAKTEKSRSWK